MNKKYDILVFIGRFSPFHMGHRRVVELALEDAHRVLILVGSSYQPRTIKNPFTYNERAEMILVSIADILPEDEKALTIRPLRDYPYNDQTWMAEVQSYIKEQEFDIPQSEIRIGIIGHEKDESSYYLKFFPQYDFVDVGEHYIDMIDATTIRDIWLSGQSPRFAQGTLSKEVHDYIFSTFPQNEYKRLVKEYNHINDYKKQWSVAPYPVTFVTVDACVIQSGHVLLVKRRAEPGAGTWALPGGFINQHERLEDAMLRELREETKVKVPEPVLRGNIKVRDVYDYPYRSLRGRTITHAYGIELPAGMLPKVKGSDDAAKAQWVPLSKVQRMEDEFFEDHFYILNDIVGKMRS